jgi:hypothetical protein
MIADTDPVEAVELIQEVAGTLKWTANTAGLVGIAWHLSWDG